MPDVTAVAMSGGVDSSVAACLLAEEYHSSFGRPVVGVSQLIWAKESQFPAALDLAREVCFKLGIPYFRVDLKREFDRLVVRKFIDTYLEGQTPNPCVLCNQMIKFDTLYRRVESELRARGNLGAQDTLYFATGHYARVDAEEGGYVLKKGRDESKDQSYMLYRLPRSLLSRIVFPLACFEKNEVICMATRLDLPHREIRESQDACFLEGSYGDYLVERTGRVDLRQPGEIVDTGGKVLGRHRGFIRYTVGQRKGLGLGSGPWYVSRIDPIKNRVVVGRREEVLRRSFEVSDVNWLADREESAFTCTVKVRYQTREIKCVVRPLGPDCLGVELAAGEMVTPGQSAVFYRDDRVLCGGIIQAPA